ncbi:hypothetical protein BKA82DRAFT_4362564 [Pisolithus tinctorius]|nr:hypothetical protein BKA82DRAFT_4362564 [Pisolithus tinctorius]
MDVVGDAFEHSTDSLSDSYIEDPRFAISCKDSCFDAGAEHHVNEEVKVEDAQPLAYAQVPQLEATLATSDVDQFGEWTILMASSATKDLFQLRRRDAKMAECVLKKIRQVSLRSQEQAMSQFCTCRQLSRGEFSGNNYKAFHGPSHGIPIYQAEVLSNLRLVYQIDCTLDDDGQTERQGKTSRLFCFRTHLPEVVKVYGIYSHKQLNHIWPWLSKFLSGRGKVYRQRCILRERAEPGNGVYRPAIFPPGVEEFTIEQSPTFVHQDGTNEDLSWLISNKYVKLSKAYLNGLIAEQEVQLPFQLTTKEWQIVQCLTSCYVIGRSGTGKTTAMAFKMLGIQRAWEQLPGVRKPRQLFVTRFPVLAAKVQEFFTSLVDSLALAGCTEDELRTLRSLIRSAEQEQPPMIDPLNAQNCCLAVTSTQRNMIVLKFILDKAINDESLYVTYEVFSTQYWPQLCDTYRSPLAQSFGPWLVFSEFMGVIKGSETAFNSPNGIIDRQTYMNLSTRAYPVFAEDRNSLYSTFELYSKLKRERYGYDMADRTYAILKALSSNTLKDHLVHYLYVDEVQDNLIIDAMCMSTTYFAGAR